jgi:hypothetical protein
MEMSVEILPPKPSFHWHTVTYDMEVVFPKIYHLVTSRRSKVRISNIPLQRNDPVKYLSSAWHLMDFQRNMLLKVPQCFAHPFSGNTPANRKQHRDQIVKCPAFLSGSQYVFNVFRFHKAFSS